MSNPQQGAAPGAQRPRKYDGKEGPAYQTSNGGHYGACQKVCNRQIQLLSS
jgi:hypothetical protein